MKFSLFIERTSRRHRCVRRGLAIGRVGFRVGLVLWWIGCWTRWICAAPIAPEILSDVNLAIRAFQEGKYEEAGKAFDEAVAKAVAYQPTADDYLREAQREIQSNNAQAALDAIARALAKDPKSANAHLLRGRIERLTGENNEAFESLNKAMELDPELGPAAEEMWELLSNPGNPQFDTAIKTFQKYREKSKKNIHLLLYLGEAYLAVNDFDRAVEVFTEAVAADPKQSVFHQKLIGALDHVKGQKDSVIATYAQLVKKHPAPIGELLLARLCIRNGKLEQAIPLLERLSGADVQTAPPALRQALADVYGEAKMYAEAAEEMRRVWKSTADPMDRIVVSFELGKWLVKASQASPTQRQELIREGIEYLEYSLREHLRLRKDTPAAGYFQLGNAYYLLGEWEKAELYFRQFDRREEEVGSWDAETLELLGDIYMLQRNWGRAVEYYKRLVDHLDRQRLQLSAEQRDVDARNRIKLARAFLEQGAEDQRSLEYCIPLCRQMLAEEKYRKDASLLLAKAYLRFESPQTENAIEVLRGIEGTASWDDEASALMGQAMLSKNAAEALKFVKSAYEAKPKDEDRCLLYAEVVLTLDEFEEARGLYQRVLRDKPRSDRALKGMGDLEYRRAAGLPASERVAHLREAVTHYDEAVKAATATTKPTVLRSLGDAKRELARAEAEMRAQRQRLVTIVLTCVVASALTVIVGVIVWLVRRSHQERRGDALFRRIKNLEVQLRTLIRKQAEKKLGEAWQERLGQRPFSGRFNHAAAKQRVRDMPGRDVLEGSYFGEIVGIIDVGWEELGIERPVEPDRKKAVLSALAYVSSWRNIMAAHGLTDSRDEGEANMALQSKKAQARARRFVHDHLEHCLDFVELELPLASSQGVRPRRPPLSIF